MPPKKAKKAAEPVEPAEPATGPALTDQYNEELKGLASQAQNDALDWTQLAYYLQGGAILFVMGIFSHVSALALSPVYGTVPTEAYHFQWLAAGSFVGWASNLAIRNNLPRSIKSWQLLPILTAYVPMIQCLLMPFSQQLGAKYGPLITEGVTILPVSIIAASSAADLLEGMDLTPWVPKFFAEALPGLSSWTILQFSQKLTANLLQYYVGKSFLFTRIAMESLVSAVYAVLAPSKWLVLAVPALLHTSFCNPHIMTPGATVALNQTLQAANWTLIERKESVTGYMSVLESMEKGFRVMRCDHSLLGGQWVVIQGQKAAEPIYGVFVMLEAVRLVETKDKPADKDASALVVGLGIGTTPSAFVDHGINTTVVEIDPVVHEFATNYFGLKENNPPAIADAVSYTANQVEAGQTYDYIVHDVFTGGVEPVDLFTYEFLKGLSDLLKPNGVIAINYAGDFTHAAPKIVIRTITQVFPTCRIFRESPVDPNLKEGEADFTNMVVFCTKTTDALKFRPARVEDFLQSRARQFFLEPKHEVPDDFLDEDEDADSKVKGIMRKNETEKIVRWHRPSAHGHWNVIRTVIPANIWELW